MENVTKRFGKVVANNAINLELREGEILSLLGENGSGKTTLMNMLSGIYFPDEGQIYIHGKPVTIASPKDAFNYGIGMIHQHFKLVDVFTATENIVLGLEGKLDLTEAGKKVKEICDKYGFDIDPNQKIYDMSVSQKQTVEIVKVLFRGADILILDEPTAVLTPQETDKLFQIMRNMKADGKSLIIITHKLHEVLDVSDRVAVLRKGEYIGDVATKDADQQSLTDMMVGHSVSLNIDRPDPVNVTPRLVLDGLTVFDELGVKRLVDLIGRTDLLKELDGFTAKQQKLDLGKLLETAEPHPGKALYCTENNPPFDNGVLNAQLLQQAKPYVDEKQSKTFWFDIRNTDRSVGASLSGYIAQTHGDQGLAGDPIVAHFSGTAGQSFGVWNAGGVELHLTGDANDYVGKGMAGGLLAIRPPVGSAFRSHEASIIGNTCLYGATGGRLYAAGRAGERFAVRNSGAITVVEGIGDNGCEYMTGGIVCVLGKTGVNFGAGMTGGFAYVLDEDGDFRKRVNPELVEVLDVDSLAIHEEHLRGLITEHVQLTGSQRGEEILANWPAFSAKFALVKPKSSDVKALLGHRSRSAAELRVQAQ